MRRLLPFLLVPGAALAQSPPDCLTLLGTLRTAVETNYAGYHIEVRPARLAAHEAMYARLAADAAGGGGDACYAVLYRYVRWFNDPHLFVFQSTVLDSADTRRRADSIRRTLITERVARAYFDSAGALDPIEGIWTDGQGLRLAVVPDPAVPHRFQAVVLTSDTVLWPVGAVRAAMTPDGGGAYRVDLRSRNMARRLLHARVHKEVILRLSPGIWMREYPAPPMPGLVSRDDPRRPTLVRHGRGVIISVVSHDPQYAPVLDSLVSDAAAALDSAAWLIIDLRGNEGGSSWTTRALVPYLTSRDERPVPYGGDTTVMLSSPAQIAYARRAFGADTTAWVRELVRRLEAAPGRLVALPPDDPRAPDTLMRGPTRVGVIVDGGTVSAGEALVLRALRSTRAEVFGEPTAGALDYPSVNIVRVHRNEQRWFLGYPTMAASRRLPQGGMRGRGIQPDVAIPVAALWGPMLEVERRLAAR